MLGFLHGRVVTGVERIDEGAYYRTVRIDGHYGWIAVRHVAENSGLSVEYTPSLTPVLPQLITRLRNLFDLDAQPELIAPQLRKDPLLRRSVEEFPGLRVPGAFDGFELAIRTVLGQQITVKAATTLSCRFGEAFGEAIDTPFAQLSRLAPLPERVARASVDDVAKLGIVGTRAKCIIALAQAVVAGDVVLGPDAWPEHTLQQLAALSGIGPWTTQYIAMRALRCADAFPKEDIAVRNKLGRVSAGQAEQMSHAWQPWRSYAVLHIWRMPAAGN